MPDRLLQSQLESERLILSGALSRATANALQARLRSAQRVRIVDLSAVTEIDSAGLATLAQWMRSLTGDRPTLFGNPAGLAELRSAYRLDKNLDPARVDSAAG